MSRSAGRARPRLRSPSWRAGKAVGVEASDLVESAQGFFDARVHKTLATLREDGSPRISGIEASFVEEGSGSPPSRSRSRRETSSATVASPYAVADPVGEQEGGHSTSEDPPDWKGDAKVAGRAEEVTDPATVERVFRAMGSDPPSGPSPLRADIEEVVVTRLGEPPDHLVIESWHEGRGVRRIERR